uniref:Rqc2 homolog RqcH n=2 Tax=Candidatus Bipolaricaulota TaxID=67810 RepID=H5S9Z3_9BACT|nr:fibronectin-binding A domain protein [uncultured Acetothermia bacterium]BAL59247.1 fibronectin-binding A domain protein [Candidatus Acetothermum autotrophicum]
MNIDGLTVSALVAELRERLCGSRVQQIYHPRPSTITLELWAGEEQSLLIETAEQPRVHLTQQRFPHPKTPSAFCMLLRKYLRNGIIVGVSQPALERIIDLTIRHGEEYILRTELLGKHANVIVLRGERIVGALNSAMGQRSFRPTEVYHAPPTQGKLDPRTMTQEEFLGRLDLSPFPSPARGGELPLPFREGDRGVRSVAQALFQVLEGIGPRLAQEIALRAGLDPAQPLAALTAEQRLALWNGARQLCANVCENPSPCLYGDGDNIIDVAPVPLRLYAHLRCEHYATLSEALDEYVRRSPEHNLLAHEQHRLHEIVRGHSVKVRTALERIAHDLASSRDYERLRHEGELLLAHLSQLRKGLSEIALEDFRDGTKKIIQLDPTLDPVANAQQKFARYKKLKRAQEKLAARLEELRQELEYLENIEHSLEHAESEAALAEIREELGAAGYLPRARREPARAIGPREFLIRGYRVLVGRSSKQNDELVRSASREDYWLHARDRPGSHVIIKNPKQREIPRDVLEQAAQLAAYYSKGRDAQKVPVSYTRVKYLRKGGRPGLVLVTHEEGTLTVTPKGEL